MELTGTGCLRPVPRVPGHAFSLVASMNGTWSLQVDETPVILVTVTVTVTIPSGVIISL